MLIRKTASCGSSDSRQAKSRQTHKTGITAPRQHLVCSSPSTRPTHRQRRVHETQPITPRSPTRHVFDHLAPGHHVRGGVPPILVEHGHDHLGLFGREERVLVREVDDEEDGEDTEGDGEGACASPKPSYENGGDNDLSRIANSRSATCPSISTCIALKTGDSPSTKKIHLHV